MLLVSNGGGLRVTVTPADGCRVVP